MKKLIVILFICCSALFAENYDFAEDCIINSITVGDKVYEISGFDSLLLMNNVVTEIYPLNDEYCRIKLDDKYIVYLKSGDEIRSRTKTELNTDLDSFIKIVICHYKIKTFSYNKIELEFVSADLDLQSNPYSYNPFEK